MNREVQTRVSEMEVSSIAFGLFIR